MKRKLILLIIVVLQLNSALATPPGFQRATNDEAASSPSASILGPLEPLDANNGGQENESGKDGTLRTARQVVEIVEPGMMPFPGYGPGAGYGGMGMLGGGGLYGPRPVVVEEVVMPAPLFGRRRRDVVVIDEADRHHHHRRPYGGGRPFDRFEGGGRFGGEFGDRYDRDRYDRERFGGMGGGYGGGGGLYGPRTIVEEVPRPVLIPEPIPIPHPVPIPEPVPVPILAPPPPLFPPPIIF